MLQRCGSPVAVPLGAGTLLALPPGLRGRGRLPVWLCSGSVPVQRRGRLDPKHAGTGLFMCLASMLSNRQDAFTWADNAGFCRSSSRLPPSSPGCPAPPAAMQSFISADRTRCTRSSARWSRWAWPTCWTSALSPTASPLAAGRTTLHFLCTSCR